VHCTFMIEREVVTGGSNIKLVDYDFIKEGYGIKIFDY